MIRDWPELRDLALSLDLPEITLARPWGHEALKAFCNMGCNWSHFEVAAAFRANKDLRDILMQAAPDPTVARSGTKAVPAGLGC